MFCVDLRTNSDYFPTQHYLTGLYNRDGVCLLRGTDWVFIFVLRFLFKALKWPSKGSILFRIPNTLFNLSSFRSERNGSFVCLE